MIKRVTLVAALLWAGATSPLLAKQLVLGDPAPKLDVKEYLKGEPVKGFEKGKIYVVEFWATWCGPCRETIPHLTELQKQHKDVKFLGVSVFEQDQALVKPFVDEMGSKMDYTVAMDSVAKGQDGQDGSMAKNWMVASGEEGIPTAYVVDGDGKIAWIGHPKALDKPLEQMLEGKYDLKAAIAERTEAKKAQEKLNALQAKLEEAQSKGGKAFAKAIDDAVAELPQLEEMLATPKFFALISKTGDPGLGLTYGSKLVDGLFKDNPDMLNNMAWAIVDPEAEKRDEATIKLALKAATRADELSAGKNSAYADTLAKAQFDSGELQKAVDTQERALKNAEKDTDGLDDMRNRLEMYRTAAKNGKK